MEGEFALSDMSISFKRKLGAREGKLSNADVVLTLVSSTAGIGFLVLPLSFAHCGWGLSIFLCVLITVLQVNANYALIRVAAKLKVADYPDLVLRVVESRWRIRLVHNLLFFMNFSTTVSYVLTIISIFSSTMKNLSKSKVDFLRRVGGFFADFDPLYLVLLINALLAFFVIFRNKFLNFSWLAFSSVCAMLFAVICVSAVSFLKRDASITQTSMTFAKFEGLPHSLYIFVFAFMNSPSLIELYVERNLKNVRKFKRVLYLAFFFIFVVYVVLSMSAYYGAGDLLIGYQKANILLAPYSDFVVGQVANLFVVVFLFVHTTLQFIPNKQMLMTWLGVANRSSYLFHVLAISLLVAVETVCAVIIVRLDVSVKTLIMCIVVISAPIVAYHFPFYAFLKTFHGVRAEDLRAKSYTALLFLGLYIHVAVAFFWLMSLLH